DAFSWTTRSTSTGGIVEAEAIDEVVATAHRLLRERHKHRAVEIWEGPQRLYRNRGRANCRIGRRGWPEQVRPRGENGVGESLTARGGGGGGGRPGSAGA